MNNNIALNFFLAVWGDHHTELCIKLCLPSLMSKNNIQAISTTKGHTLWIYSTENSIKKIKNSSIYQNISATINVEFNIILEADISCPTIAINTCYRELVNKVSINSKIIWLAPDIVWADGTFSNLYRIAESGKKIVICPYFRAKEASFTNSLLDYTSDDTIKISPRDLVRLGLENIHPISQSLFWDSPNFNSWPCQIYWKVSPLGIIAKYFHAFPLMTTADKNVLPEASSFEAIDGGCYLDKLVTDRDDIYVAQDSDTMFCCEAVNESYTVHPYTQEEPQIIDIADWAIRNSNDLQRYFFEHNVIIHADDICEKYIDKIIDINNASNTIKLYIKELYSLDNGNFSCLLNSNTIVGVAASILLGRFKNADIITLADSKSSFAKFYLAVYYWLTGDDEKSFILLHSTNSEHSQNLIKLLAKPQINILAQLDRGSWSDLLQAVKNDSKFSIRNIGFKPGDLPNHPQASIHEYYNPTTLPDFYITKMLEWHLIPPDIQELPCPTFAQTADYDIHIQAIYPWLKAFDELIIEHEWEDVSKLAKVPVSTYPKSYPLLAEVEQRSFPVGDRDIDVFISGTTFHPYHPDKAKLLNDILTLEGFNVCFVDGFLDTADYLNLLARTKICITYIRRPGMPTRGIEALAMGCAVLVQEDSALRLYLQEQQGIFTYTDNNLDAVIRNILQNWGDLAPAIKAGSTIIRREFATRTVASQYCRFLTYLAAKPRPNRTLIPREDLEQKRLILLRGWLQTPEVYKAIQQTTAQRLDSRQKQHPNASYVINIAREMVLAHASTAHEATALEFARIFKASIPPDPALFQEALHRYKKGIKQFPEVLILRFNYIRTALIFGHQEEKQFALKIARETIETPLSIWELDPMHDVFPWDYFSQLFNYRRYFDLVTEQLKNDGGQSVGLCKLVMASIHFHLSFFVNDLVHAAKAVELDPDFPFYGLRYAQLLSNDPDFSAQVRAADLFFILAKSSMLSREAYQCLKALGKTSMYALKQCNLLQRKFELVDSRVFKASNNYGDFNTFPFNRSSHPESPQNMPPINNKTKHPPSILYIPLEFGTWKDARHWSYTLSWGIEESLTKAGAECLTIPALWGRSPDDPSSWLHHIKRLCAGKRFDQIWFTANHTPLDSSLLKWLADQAPIRVGIFCESLRISDEEKRINSDVSRQREETVQRCLSVMTHAIVVDEADVNLLATRGIDAQWLPASIPQFAITDVDDAVPTGNQAVFYGALYGARKSFLEYPNLTPLLIKPERSLEESTDLPVRYDQLQAIIQETLVAQPQQVDQILQKYLEVHRSFRRSGFELWLKTLSTAPVVVNLPQYGFMYSGRVAEAMAAGRPVIAARIANRLKTEALFADGRDILLYDQNNPDELAEKILLLLNDRTYARQIALNAQQRLRDDCLIETQIASILNSIDSAAQPPARKELGNPATPLRLHLGCGEQYLEGYTNIDYPPSEHAVMQVKADRYADITTLQYPPGSVDEIRLHHVFEHFNRVTALALLIRWHEWLKPGGILHIETPDLEGSAKIILSNLPWPIKSATVRHLAGDHADSWAYHIDHWFPERFRHTLEKLGFSDILTSASNWPHEPYLANVTVTAKKISSLSRADLVQAADQILLESTVSTSEQATYAIWKNQLRMLLAGQTTQGFSAPTLHALSQSGNQQIPLAEIHDFNQHSRDKWMATKAASVEAGESVLDVGAGTCPYRTLFSHCVYKTHDFMKYSGEKLGGTNDYGNIDYVSEITAIPVPDNSFDVVICTEVLEHVPNPILALTELSRIVRPGGRLLITAPLGSGLHQLPYHYYGGFSPEWYHHWGRHLGLEVVETTPNGGFFRLLAQECTRAAHFLVTSPELAPFHEPDITTLLRESLPRLLFRFEETCFIDQFTVGYHVEMRKPPADANDRMTGLFDDAQRRYRQILALKQSVVRGIRP